MGGASGDTGARSGGGCRGTGGPGRPPVPRPAAVRAAVRPHAGRAPVRGEGGGRARPAADPEGRFPAVRERPASLTGACRPLLPPGRVPRCGGCAEIAAAGGPVRRGPCRPVRSAPPVNPQLAGAPRGSRREAFPPSAAPRTRRVAPGRARLPSALPPAPHATVAERGRGRRAPSGRRRTRRTRGRTPARSIGVRGGRAPFPRQSMISWRDRTVFDGQQNGHDGLRHGASRATVREGGRTLQQPPAQHNAEAAVREPALAAGVPVRESDLVDLAAWPLTAEDGLAPLRPGPRLLSEVLRSRGGIRGGGESGGGQGARAE